MWHKCRENYNRMNCGTAQEDKYVGLGQVSLGSAPWTVMMIAGRACGGMYAGGAEFGQLVNQLETALCF